MPLGKSLGNILDDYFGETPESNSAQDSQGARAVRIPINQIEIGSYQTRTEFDQEKLNSLAKNIQEHGLIQPILVLETSANNLQSKYILLAGERRLRAVKLIGQDSILAIVKPQESLTPKQQAMISAMENLQREDLSPLELAKTFQMLIKTEETDEAGLAVMLGNTSQYVKNYLRLLTTAPQVQEALAKRLLTEGQARHLVPLEPNLQVELLRKILEQELTVREIAQLIKDLNKPKPKPSARNQLILPSTVHNRVSKLYQEVAEVLPNSNLSITGSIKRGKITISWKD